MWAVGIASLGLVISTACAQDGASGGTEPQTVDCSLVDCVPLTREDCQAPQVYVDSGCCGACADPPEEDCSLVDCMRAECEAPQVYVDSGCCGACADPPGAPLWCPDSPDQTCRMLCEEPRACPDGQCNTRTDNCCATSCQAYTEPEACSCCPEGAACFAPDPPCCAERAVSSGSTATTCALGEDCGGTLSVPLCHGIMAAREC